MIAHVVFYNIAPALSDTLIIICTAMMCFFVPDVYDAEYPCA